MCLCALNVALKRLEWTNIILTNLHHVIYSTNVIVLQPEWNQAEHPGVMLLTLLQTLNVILHRLTQEALSVCLKVGQGLHIQLQLPLHLCSVPARSEWRARRNRSIFVLDTFWKMLFKSENYNYCPCGCMPLPTRAVVVAGVPDILCLQ